MESVQPRKPSFEEPNNRLTEEQFKEQITLRIDELG
jgi:hypothetical protein